MDEQAVIAWIILALSVSLLLEWGIEKLSLWMKERQQKRAFSVPQAGTFGSRVRAGMRISRRKTLAGKSA